MHWYIFVITAFFVENSPPTITFLNVEQGDMTVIDCDGLTVLDGANSTAKDRITDYIADKPIKTLIITHFHPDHFLGIKKHLLTTSTKVDLLIRGPGNKELDPHAARVLVVNKTESITHRICPSVKLEIFAAPDPSMNCDVDLNNCGLAVLVSSNDKYYALLGDKTNIWYDLQSEVLGKYKFELITASHHGNQTWNRDFISLVLPKYILISASPTESGNYGYLGYPRCETLKEINASIFPIKNEASRFIKCCRMLDDFCVWDQVSTSSRVLFTAKDQDISFDLLSGLPN